MANASVTTRRWWVHLALIVTLVISLVFEFVLSTHIIVGLVFLFFVGTHLVQRRRISTALARRLARVSTLHRRAGRLALSDALLLALTVAMLTSGFVDVALGHPTRVRWHAIFGVVLAIYLVVHTIRRRSRLKSSRIS
ncbi:MAG TPA: hypothetical protein VIJ99_09135 [Acidimicrobiales bacterium]